MYSTSELKEQRAAVENLLKVDVSTGGHKGSESIPASKVLKTLAAILLSTPFRTSKQAQQLLQYIVDETLAGRPETLKERIIGMKVFNRPPDYDTNSDPIVRLRVAEVRKRLALYYQKANDELVLISVPSGSFKAVFEWARPTSTPPVFSPRLEQEPTQSLDELITQPEVPEAIHHDLPPSFVRFHVRKGWFAVAASVLILALVILRYVTSSEQRALDQFWSPVLSSDMALIFIGNNPVYDLSPSFVEDYFKAHPQNQDEETGAGTYFSAPPEIADAKDVVAAKDTYVSNGDVAATSKIVSLLSERGEQFDIRYGSDLTFGDVRLHPTVLIGAHNNYWTLRTTKNLRVGFEGLNTIIDRSDQQKRWTPSSVNKEDYALVSRVLNSWNGKVIIVVAGVGQGGTRAAADFVTNPQSIAKLVKSLPRGWENKNIQIVLHTTVKNQIPSAPEVVATYCW